MFVLIGIASDHVHLTYIFHDKIRKFPQNFPKNSWAHTKTCLFKYTENFITKKWKFSNKKFWYLSYFCSKHRLWVLVRTASTSGSNEYPQSLFLSRNKKNDVYPSKPQFCYIKVGFKGVKLYRRVFVMMGRISEWYKNKVERAIGIRVFGVFLYI